jgi:Ca2+-binding EF-hand superfamily protein
MRWLREAEVTHVQKLLKKYDSDGSGEVDRQELLSLLSELGYTANHEAIQNAVEDAKLKANDENFDFNELWRLLHVFRRRCGFTRNEDKDIIAAHGRYDHKNEGMISTLELGKALRLLGYSVAVPTQKKLLEQVDVDGSGRLDLAEFRTLMRMQREDELSEMKDIFRHYANKEDKVSAADLPRALRRAGCLQPDGSIPAETTKVVKNLPGGIDFDTFWKIVSSQFKASRERMRESAGFTAPEVANFKKMFIDFDADGGGDIKGAELRALMRCIFPDVGMTMGDRKLMEQILNDVDQDGSGSLDFADFLRLMRHYHDEHDRKQLENMWEGFTDEEARQFKGIFDSEDIRKTGHLPPNQVVAMIQRICPMGTEALGELTKLLTEVRNGSSNVDFTAFLRVMRHIIDVDLAGINGHAARVTEAKAMPF